MDFSPRNIDFFGGQCKGSPSSDFWCVPKVIAMSVNICVFRTTGISQGLGMYDVWKKRYFIRYEKPSTYFNMFSFFWPLWTWQHRGLWRSLCCRRTLRTVIQNMKPMWIATICQDLTQGKSLQLLAETRQDCASRLHPLEPQHNFDLLAFEAFEDWRSQSFHIRRCNSSSARVVTKRLRLDDGWFSQVLGLRSLAAVL